MFRTALSLSLSLRLYPIHFPPPHTYDMYALCYKVLNHVGETWICFIRIMVQDPFDDQLDIRIIHDREEVKDAACTCCAVTSYKRFHY